MRVLSLFDGISCGRLALQKLGIEVDEYYACEIKSHAVKITQENFPNTIQLGDVTKLKGNDLPKIDLIVGGSPCQSFSGAMKNRTGLEGKSGLFFEYVRVLNEVNPKYFLLENVASMKREDKDFISKTLGVEPIMIDSALLSGQLRKRLYWTNIQGITQPKDRGILLQSILKSGYTDRNKSRCLLESDSRPLSTPLKMFHRYYSTGFTTLIFKDKQHYLDCVEHYNINYKGLSALQIDITSKEVDNSVYAGLRYLNQEELEELQTVPKGYTSSVSRNEAACVLGDGWTVDVISQILSFMR